MCYCDRRRWERVLRDGFSQDRERGRESFFLRVERGNEIGRLGQKEITLRRIGVFAVYSRLEWEGKASLREILHSWNRGAKSMRAPTQSGDHSAPLTFVP